MKFSLWKNRSKQKFFPLSIFFLIFHLFLPHPSWGLPLSPGDILEVSIPDDEYFVGFYRVNQDGNIEIPYVGSIPVVGKEPLFVQSELAHVLIKQGFFLPGKLPLSIEIIQWGGINVTVSGETFQPGRILINEDNQSEKDNQLTSTERIKGDYPVGRYLTNAIRIAGGVLPTADITQVKLIRDEQETIVDLSGVFTGEPVEDIALVHGDRIIVPKSKEFHPELVRPSQITPPGIKIFASNLTVPASSNASSAVSNVQEGITLPYGSRFSHAVVASNCTGGTKSVNAGRNAILVRADSLTGETSLLETDIEDLLRNAENNEENPLLMPKDAVACYDSSFSNTRDVFRTIADILSPLSPILLFRNLFR